MRYSGIEVADHVFEHRPDLRRLHPAEPLDVVVNCRLPVRERVYDPEAIVVLFRAEVF